jgi:hypothetical protein
LPSVPTIVHPEAALASDVAARAAGTATDADANAIAEAKSAAVSFGVIPAPVSIDIRGEGVPNALLDLDRPPQAAEPSQPR